MQLTLVEDILGGEEIIGQKLENKMDLIELSKVGLTKTAVSNLAEYLTLSWKQLADLLPVTERTLQRYSNQKNLNPTVSEQVLHIAEVTAKGTEVFEDKAKFILWLHIPHKAFSNKTPLALLSSGFGAELVLQELGRIEFGVYS